MPYRLVALCILLLSAAIPASGIPLSPALTVLSPAAEQYRVGAFRGSYESALKAPESPERTFLLGMAAWRTAQWETAVALLAKAADSYPLLADFALYHGADALCRLNRFDEAIPLLQRLRIEYPDSPLLRRALKLTADAQIGRKDYRSALAMYQYFITRYPAGQDSIAASFQLAFCREELGDRDAAVARYRAIWRDYPASPFAERADEALRRLAADGVAVPPYTPDELLQRGNTLYSLRRYPQALAVFDAISSAQPAEFRRRVSLKRGLAQYRARRYRDAEKTLAGLDGGPLAGSDADEIAFWHARALDRTGRKDEALATYRRVVETWPRSSLADDALLYAASVLKGRGRWDDARAMLDRIVATYPDCGLKQTALWQSGWAAYQAKEYPAAVAAFTKLTSSGGYREKALYWSGRAHQAAGEPDAATQCYTALRTEFPLGYYTLQYLSTNPATPSQPLITGDLIDLIPQTQPLERAAALIALGMYDEAHLELAVVKKRNRARGRQTMAIVRMYLEMGDYSGAAGVLRQEPPRQMDQDNLYVWGINYPDAFRSEIARFAAANGLDPSLVFALVRAESRFSPRAKSPVGARGLMQLMPATARAVDGSVTDPDRLYQPEVNLRLGTRHLKGLLDYYNGNIVPVIASYNAGSGNVDRWLKEFGAMDRSEFIENIPFPETRDYVKKVLVGREIYRRLYLTAPTVATRSN